MPCSTKMSLLLNKSLLQNEKCLVYSNRAVSTSLSTYPRITKLFTTTGEVQSETQTHIHNSLKGNKLSKMF